MIAYIVNPLLLFWAVWGTATTLYAGGVWVGMFPWPQPLTIDAFLLNLSTFSLGYLTWSLFQDLPRRSAPGGLLVPSPGAEEAPALLRIKPLTQRRLLRAVQVTLFVGVVTLLMEFYRLHVLAGRVNTSWWFLLTHPTFLRHRLVQSIAAGVSEASPLVMALSAANSIFSAGFVLLGLVLYFERTSRRYAYLSAFLLLSLIIGLLHLTRYEMTANILYLVFAYCFAHTQAGWELERPGLQPVHGSRRASSFRLIIPIAAIAVLFLAIDVLLRKSAEYGQTNRLHGFAFHFWWYMASPLAAFNEFVSTFRGDYGLGQNTFFPFYKWLCRFHLAPETEISFYGDKVLIPYMTNVYTYLRNFYEDFGLWGVTLAPYILGGVLAAVRRQAGRYLHFLNLYLVLLMFVLFSFYNFFLFSNQIYLQVLFGFVFLRYEMQGRLKES